MIYIYDILLNFCDNNLIYDFYEWNNNDDIENIKKIGLFHVSREVFDDLLNYECIIDSKLLIETYRTCEVYKSKRVKVLDYCFLISDGDRVLALELNKEGRTIYKSKLLLDEEEEIAILASNLEIYNFNYKIIKKVLNNRYFTREELLIRNYLYKEIESSYKNRKYDKLRYLYQEYFDKDNISYKSIKNELIDSIKYEINDKHRNLYNLLKISSKKKQV